MHPHDALLTYALIGIPAGLATGLALGLVAQRDGGWGGYASFRRRAARLGHVSLVMLPLLAGFYALALRGRELDLALAWGGTWLWIAGAPLLAVALFLAAWRPRLRLALPLPATAVTTAGVLFALAWLKA